MPYIFNDKVALVTGSSRGIGRAILLALARNGCDVILQYFRQSPEAKKTICDLKSTKSNFSIFPTDVTNELEVKRLFHRIQKKYKKLDILINNVGSYLKKPLDKLTTNEWHKVINSNLHSAFYCTYYSLPLLKRSKFGRIINIGYASTGQIVAKPKILPYQIAKTGVLLMTKAYAVTLAKNNILVNMISPGVMENSIYRPKKEIPLKKTGSLEGLTKLILQTIESDYTTGAHIEYAGGFNL